MKHDIAFTNTPGTIYHDSNTAISLLFLYIGQRVGKPPPRLFMVFVLLLPLTVQLVMVSVLVL
jgi:hypothetical protein